MERVKRQESLELNGLRRVFRSFQSVACQSYSDCNEKASDKLSDKLKGFIKDYFQEQELNVEAWESYCEKSEMYRLFAVVFLQF